MGGAGDDPGVEAPVVDGEPTRADGAAMVRAACPHCGAEDSWGVPIGVSLGDSGGGAFPVGCGHCGRGFRIRYAHA